LEYSDVVISKILEYLDKEIRHMRVAFKCIGHFHLVAWYQNTMHVVLLLNFSKKVKRAPCV